MVTAVKPLMGLLRGLRPFGEAPSKPGDPASSPFVLNLADLLQSLFVAPVDPPRLAEMPREVAVRPESAGSAPVETPVERPREVSAEPDAPRESVERVEETDEAAVRPEEAGTRAEAPEAPAPEVEIAAPERYRPIELPPAEVEAGSEARSRGSVVPPASESTSAPAPETAEAEAPKLARAPQAPAPVSEVSAPVESTGGPRPQIRVESVEGAAEPPPPPAPAPGKCEAPAGPPPAPPAGAQLPPQASAVAEVRAEPLPRSAGGESRGFGSARDGQSLAAASRAARPAATTPDASRVEFVERLMKAARFTMIKGQSRMKLVLNPPNLGHLKVDLSVREHVLRGSLRAETPAARDLIVSQIPTLRDQLERQGIHLGAFDVNVDAQSGQAGRQDGHGAAPSEPAPRPGVPESSEPAAPAERPRPARHQLIDVVA